MVYTNEEDEAETYDNDCRLTKISTRWGFEQVLTHNLSVASGGDGNPLTVDRVNTRYIVTGGATQAIRFVRDGVGRISQLVTPGGEITQFNYDGQSRLSSVNYPAPVGTTTRTYHYENASFPHALTGITDENGQRYATWTYDTQGRAYISEHAGGADRVQFTFNSNGTTGVQSPLGQQQTHHIGVQHDLGKLTQVAGGPCQGCGSLTATQIYDTNGFADLKTDFNGNQTDLDLNARGLETQRLEGKGTAHESEDTHHLNQSPCRSLRRMVGVPIPAIPCTPERKCEAVLRVQARLFGNTADDWRHAQLLASEPIRLAHALLRAAASSPVPGQPLVDLTLRSLTRVCRA